MFATNLALALTPAVPRAGARPSRSREARWVADDELGQQATRAAGLKNDAICSGDVTEEPMRARARLDPEGEVVVARERH